ncbi:class I SAM-dependent methyltransferase [Alicyclobacillus sp.]|uniref:class I SAM-dependent methyltransferase n=1 Tax=Alicyclobacillus sp. TaxID=61169 RepID=UPI0025C25681|nr:class I SAM-dependent methyltransferase [Alicyclobacillus sp.]MCL6518117.1 class I SAM-dependent methyltransferase [Alicyclobacillus sp.]
MDYQDALAEVGAGVAHPGGWRSTERWMQAIPWTPGLRVLDVGCGTGRSLVTLAQRYGVEITGIDVRKKMIQHARRRAARAGVRAQWRVGSAEHLPFPNEHFDVVITESVNVFVDARRALAEYWRVLKPDGYYVDVEMFIRMPVDEAWRQAAAQVYGVRMVPDQAGWRRLYREAGFTAVEVLESRAVRPEEMMTGDGADEWMGSPTAYQNPRVLAVLQANAQWMDLYHKSLGYAVFLCRKPA